MSGLVIIGGSYAAQNIIASARQAGYAEPIRMVTEERHLPYNRPPLSKAFLLGKVPLDSLPLKSEAFYRDNGVEVVFGTRIERVDLQTGRAETASGVGYEFDRLAIATGTRARPIPVPGNTLDGVVSLRSLDDALAIQALLPNIGSVVIIGGGYIGLELAASLVSLDKDVTVLEGLDRVLARVTFPIMSGFVEQQHRHHGVKLQLGASVASIEGQHGRVSAVRTADGARYPADLVIVAIGAVPNTELAEPLGLAGRNGIEVDSCGRTANPHIVAAGDCALHFNNFAGERIRLESVHNAIDQAKAAGAAVAGVEKPYGTVPWFWSDQYDLKMQMCGISKGADREVIRGSMADHKFSIFYFRDNRLIAIDSVNAPVDHMQGRKLLAKPCALTPEQAADPGFDLRTLR